MKRKIFWKRCALIFQWSDTGKRDELELHLPEFFKGGFAFCTSAGFGGRGKELRWWGFNILGFGIGYRRIRVKDISNKTE